MKAQRGDPRRWFLTVRSYAAIHICSSGNILAEEKRLKNLSLEAYLPLLLSILLMLPSFISVSACQTMNRLKTSGKVAVEEDWPMFHHDLAHTGYSQSTAPNSDNVSWIFSTEGSIESSPAVVGGRIYIGSTDNKIYCLNATTGQFIWSYTIGGYAFSSPAAVGGFVYVGSGDHNVYCLDATTGKLIWSYSTGGKILSSPAVSEGQVYVGSQDAKVYCFNASSGEVIWNFTAIGPINASPAVSEGRVFVGGSMTAGTYDFKVWCLNSSTGEHIWNYTTESIVDSSPAIMKGKVYVGSDDWRVYCLNASTGTKIWSYKTQGNVVSSPAVVDDRVYVGAWLDFKIYCLNASTGAKLWSYQTEWGVLWSSPAVADGKVFIGSQDHKIYCLNSTTGEVIWNYQTGDQVLSSPALAYGRVYVGSDDGRLYVFGPPIHDLAAYQIHPMKSSVSQGYSLNVEVVVENQGGYTEDYIIRLYANESFVGMGFGYDLASCERGTATISWNTTGFALGSYTLEARVVPVPDEADTTDNHLANSWILVTIPGDVDGDRDVDIYDIVRMAGVYGVSQPDPKYDAYCDIDNDGDIDIYDIVIAAGNYGETWL